MSYPGELCALITAVLWTGGMLAFAEATKRVGSVYVNVLRLLTAVALLFLTIAIGGFYETVTIAQVGYLIISGLIGFVFGDTFLFKSFEYTSARISSLVMSSAPAITALLAFIFLDETLSVTGLLGVVITLAGITFVILERKEVSSHHLPVSMVGVFYAFLGATGQAGGLILAKCAFTLGPINGFLATFIRAFAAALVITPLNYFAGRFTQPKTIFSKDRGALGFTILGALFGPFLGVTFSLIAISLTKVAIAATIMATVPILMLPTIRILYNEKLSWRAIIGAGVAVSGVGILFLR
jgi:drug/metabolite transporter (DMT)-like permease